MDGFEEKKWFVYLKTHHEGPFSLADIQGMMTSGQVGQTDFVWMEGMPDWKVMTEVPAFQGVLAPAKEVQTLQMEVAVAEAAPAPIIPEEPVMAAPVSVAPKAEEPIQLDQVIAVSDQKSAKSATEVELDEGPLVLNVASGAADEGIPLKKRGGLLKYVFGLFLLIAIVVGYFQAQDSESPMAKQVMAQLQPVLLKLSEVVPPLANWVSPLPVLEDISPEELKELRAASMANLEEVGPKIALAYSNSDPVSPSFYVASNLPDGTVIDIFVEGVPETLLNQLSFSSRTQVVITKKFGKSVAVKYPDGKSIPRGQYNVYAIEAEHQPEATQPLLAKLQPLAAKVAPSVTKGFKLLSTKDYFLGGIKDATYQSRLKEYHDKLREKAQMEFGELKQFAATLQSSFQNTQAKYATIAKIKNPAARKKQWNEFHSQWKPFSDQFTQFFAEKPAAVLLTDFFYGSVYQSVDQVFRSVQELHSVQNNAMLGQVDRNSIDIQLGQATAVASGSILALMTKIEQVEKLQPGPDGMPRRDGL